MSNLKTLLKRFARLERVWRDERGSALTEFVVGLPVFMLMFVGIVNLWAVGLAGVRTKGTAHNKMWAKAIDIQTRFSPTWASQPSLAAGEAAVFHNETNGSALDYALDTAGGIAAATGLSGGIMADSYMKVRPLDTVENIGAADGRVTWNINEDYIIELDDSISNALMNDALDFGAFRAVGSGFLGTLNGVVSGTGMRPAIAGGVRYGISGDYQRYDYNVLGLGTRTAEARSHVANAPRPTSRYITFAVIRLAMTMHDNYDTAIVFKFVPDFDIPTEFSSQQGQIEAFQQCQQDNADAAANGQPEQDCGDGPDVGDPTGTAEDDFWNNTGCTGSLC